MLLLGVAAAASKSPEEYINVLGGTDNLFDFSRGNVLPETQMPWGFNGFAPETDGTGTNVDTKIEGSSNVYETKRKSGQNETDMRIYAPEKNINISSLKLARMIYMRLDCYWGVQPLEAGNAITAIGFAIGLRLGIPI